MGGKEPGRPFFFMQLADPELGFGEINGKTVGWAEEEKLLCHAVAEINRLRPAFAIVCGDMVNTYPRATKRTLEDLEERDMEVRAGMRKGTFRESRDAQVRDFCKACSSVDPSIPLICVCGNHDVGDRPNAAKIEEYRTDFGDDYYSFWISDVKFVVLNSQYFGPKGIESDAASYRDAHWSWLEGELASEDTARARHVIAFCHIPPFLKKADEPDAYFFNIPRRKRDKLLGLLAEYRVTSLFCGHYHRNTEGTFTAPSGHSLQVVTTASCGTNIDPDPNYPESHTVLWPPDPHAGVRMVRVADSVTHPWYTFDKLGGVSAADLLCSIDRDGT